MINDLTPHLPVIGVGVLQLITAIAIVSALRSGRQQNKITRMKLGIETAFSLRNEYAGMWYFVYQLHDFNSFCKTRGGDAAAEYNRAVQEEHKQGKNSLQASVQAVSHFYQKLALHYVEGLVARSALFSIWPRRDFELLDDVIIPIEESFEEHSRPAIDNMKRMYADYMRYLDRA
jgi:hypothetical protein